MKAGAKKTNFGLIHESQRFSVAFQQYLTKQSNRAPLHHLAMSVNEGDLKRVYKHLRCQQLAFESTIPMKVNIARSKHSFAPSVENLHIQKLPIFLFAENLVFVIHPILIR